MLVRIQPVEHVVSNHYKSKINWRHYETRKDFRHTYHGHFMSHYRKKPWRKVANQKFRRYKGDVQNGNWYKKYFDVQWTTV